MGRRHRRDLIGLICAVALVGCDARGATTPPEDALFSCLFGDPLELAVGEVVQGEGSGAEDFCVGEGQYLYVPFFAAADATALLEAEVSGGGVAAALDPASGASLARTAGVMSTELRSDSLTRDWAFHWRLRRREVSELEPLIPLLRASPHAPRGSAGDGALAAGIPSAVSLGDTLRLNTSTECERFDYRLGTVEAISDKGIMVADTANPAGGFTAEDYRTFAAALDTLVYPVAVPNFGAPTDIDDNGRVIVFFTTAVNELTPPGSESVVGGFFWAGDLFPNDLCPGSNTAEMFYMLVPDPAGELGNVRSLTFVERQTVDVIGHEFQHLVNASRRLYVNEADQFEQVWLNEGLSHIAEELLFYHVTGLTPRENIGLERLLSSDVIRRAFTSYALSNFARFRLYLRNPDAETLLGQDNLPTRGATWAFLRYVADHEDGPDAPLFSALVNGVEIGLVNLENALGRDPIGLMQSWTTSVYTDDAGIPVPPLFQQPSWNFRSIMPALSPEESYPLELIRLESGARESVTLQGGGAAFLRFRVLEAGRAALHARAERDEGGELRVTLVRVQ